MTDDKVASGVGTATTDAKPRVFVDGVEHTAPVPESNSQSRQTFARVIAWALIWLLAVGGTLWVFGSNRVPVGTTVAGIDIGGLTRGSAKKVLNEQLAPRLSQPMLLSIDGHPASIVPTAMGLSFNADQLVDRVADSRWNPTSFVTTGKSQSAVTVSDPNLLLATVQNLSSQYSTPATQPTINYTGTEPVTSPAVTGHVIDQASATSAILTHALDGTKVTIPLIDQPPAMSTQQAKQFAAATAKLAVSAPITLAGAEHSAILQPGEIATLLSWKVVDGKFAAQVDKDTLSSLIGAKLSNVVRRAVDATWDVKSGTPVLVPAKEGYGVSEDSLAAAFVDAIGKSGDQRTSEVSLGPIQPNVTTEQAQSLGITQKVSSFTQKFPYAQYRYTNIKQAAKKINKSLVLPDGVWSMNDTVGERTAANGFVKGTVVGEGGRFQEEYGGGVSTSATTVWTAAFYAGLDAVEHGSHLVWISRYRPGLEATVAWGQLDLKIRNNTPTGIYITTKMKPTSLTVTIWGTKVWDSVKAVSHKKTNIRPYTSAYDSSKDCVPQQGQDGFDITVDRILSKAGQQDVVQSFDTHYIPGPDVVCGKAPAGKKDLNKKNSQTDATTTASGDD